MKSSLKFIVNSCIILAVAPLFAATINVPSDQATFAAAVAAAQNGDTIVLDDGTFTLAADLAIAVRVTITARTNKDASIIDTKGKNFKFQASGCVLDKVTVVNSASGNSYNPSAGLHVNATGCCISNCVFRQIGNNLGDNARWSIYCDKADTTISGCILTNNYNQYAPGISIAGGLVENCLIADNRSKKVFFQLSESRFGRKRRHDHPQLHDCRQCPLLRYRFGSGGCAEARQGHGRRKQHHLGQYKREDIARPQQLVVHDLQADRNPLS